MQANVYEIISLGARYWFAFLGALIVWRAFRWLRKDRRAKHSRLKNLPDAGMIGEMVVLEGSDQLPEGTLLPVPRAGVLGFVRSCDIVVPVEGVSPRHVDFVFQPGKGLLLFPLRGATCVADDVELTHRSATKKYPLVHGSVLQVGQAVLRLRLFAGLDTEYRATRPYEPPYAPYEPEQMPPDWAEPPYAPEQQTFWETPPEQPGFWDDSPQEPTFWDNPPQDNAWQQPATRRRRRSHEE